MRTRCSYIKWNNIQPLNEILIHIPVRMNTEDVLKWNKPEAKGHTLSDPTYMQYLEQANSQTSGYQGFGVGRKCAVTAPWDRSFC